MKNITLLIITFALTFVSCKNTTSKETTKDAEKEKVSYISFGEEITDEGVISKEEMATKYKNLKEGDTIEVKFASSIKKVCKKKGCWMQLDLGENSKNAFVKFKDYGFFMPLNSEDREVIVNGKAFIKTTSVKDLRHYAKDAGKSKEEIEKITEPRVTLAVMSNGVLMKE